MAYHERSLTGDVDRLVAHLDRAIPGSNISGKFEAGASHHIGDARMIVRAYERFSVVGSSRVSLCLSILAVGEQIIVSAVSAGGSQAVFFKLNTFGEEAFLKRAVEALDSFPG